MLLLCLLLDIMLAADVPLYLPSVSTDHQLEQLLPMPRFMVRGHTEQLQEHICCQHDVKQEAGQEPNL